MATHSKANKLRGQLANVAQDREDFERQMRELEAQMHKGKNNMDKINRGLKGNNMTGELAELELEDSSKAKSHAKLSSSGRVSRGASNSKDGPNSSPLKTNSMTNVKSALNSSGDLSSMQGSKALSMRQTVIMPGYSRVSDWCYTGPLDSNPPTVKSNDVYEFVRWLGRGSFGDVQLVKSVEEKQLYAMKTIFSQHVSKMQETLAEVVFLRTYRHPYIVDILDSFSTHQPNILHIVMHYCEGGDLGKVITAAHKNSTSLSEHQIIKWIIQLALALHFLHENHILHRDLKPSNALLTDGGETVKLADFGLTTELENNICRNATEAGTPLYAAPEMINGEKYSYPIDCWAFGVMLHELLRLEPPFYKADTTELVKSILNDEPPEVPANYSSDIRLMCSLFLTKNPAHRLGFAAMLNDPFISSKVQSFPTTYRPKSLEERIRRAHVKQLQAQLEYLPNSQLSSSVPPPELVRLIEIEKVEKASAAAALALAQQQSEEAVAADGDGDVVGRSRGASFGGPGMMTKRPSAMRRGVSESKNLLAIPVKDHLDVVQETTSFLSGDFSDEVVSAQTAGTNQMEIASVPEGNESSDITPVNASSNEHFPEAVSALESSSPIAADSSLASEEDQQHELKQVSGGRIGLAIAEAQEKDKAIEDVLQRNVLETESARC